MQRREFLTLIGFGSTVPTLFLSANAAQRTHKPNMIFILADDLGWAELGCYGNTFNETPNLDRLAQQGMLFTDAYAAAPVCSPYRAALMTGQYPARIGITDYLRPNTNEHLGLEYVTLAEMFKSSGYVTGMTGKWHLSGYKSNGAEEETLPDKHGFDEVMVSEKTGIGGGSYFHPYDRVDKSIKKVLPGKSEYLTDRLNYEAVQFIERHKDEPFFLYKSHYSVHTALKAKPDLLNHFVSKSEAGKGPNPNRISKNNPHLAAMLKSIDEGIGMVMNKLQKLGIADNTLIVFTGDNGGESRVTENGPLRAGKSTLYEGGIRIPLVIRWPGKVKPGSVCRTPTMNIDFYSTFAEIVGAELGARQRVDGVSVLPLLKGHSISRDALYWHYPLDKPHFLGGRSSGAVRCGQWKLIEFFEDQRLELYNLADDVGEKNNVVQEYPDKVRQLHQQLSAWRRDVGAKIPAGQAAASDTESSIPRPEHPKPQFKRDAWMNLNGQWDFAMDPNVVGIKENWQNDLSKFNQKITVPFCVESKLSGLEHTDFINAVWYHRTFTVPKNWKDERVFLHFGAVDYDCRAWVNGQPVGRHHGGSVSFTFEITSALKEGENDLVVYAFDDVRSEVQPSGKQSTRRESYGVHYTRVTGIWQTVWLEARPQRFLESVHIVPDLDGRHFILTPTISSYRRGLKFRAAVLKPDGKEITSASASATSGNAITLDIRNPRPWSPSDPYLYDLRLELLNNSKVVDSVMSYAGLRKFHVEGNCFYLNNKPIFLRFVLDQGFYPEGIWTAPSDAALKADIELSMAAGFNGARLHQKVFEERFHYWADRLGYLTWAEFADWGGVHSFGNPQGVLNLEREWRDAVLRDRNHPSIVAWTPLNETAGAARNNYEAYSRSVRSIFAATRAIDPTRPINDASGYVHVKTDIFTVHDYDQNPDTFRQRYASVAPDEREDIFVRFPEISAPYEGQPYVVDEYGGSFWTADHVNHPEKAGTRRNNWGYGKSRRQVEGRVEVLTNILLRHPHISGFTYTQLTDVEQEVNGVYTYHRQPKFDLQRLKNVFGGPAAIEK